jgi:hypothetical protein
MASTVRGSGGRTRVLPWLAAAPGPLTPRLLRWLCGALTRVPVSALLGAVALAWLGVSLAGGTAGPVRVRLAAEVSALAGSPAPSALGGSDGGDGSCADSGTCGGSSWGGSFTNPRDTDMGNSSFSNVTEPVDDQNGSAASVGRYDDSSGGQSATRNRGDGRACRPDGLAQRRSWRLRGFRQWGSVRGR